METTPAHAVKKTGTSLLLGVTPTFRSVRSVRSTGRNDGVTFSLAPIRGKGPGWGLTVARRGGQARGMSSEPVAEKKKLPVIKIVVGLIVLAVAAVFLLRGVNLREWIEQAMTLIRGAGPLAFFSAMAILPGLGVPVMPFHLTAGSAFGEQLGMPWVVALCLLAVTINLVVTYALARRAMRPLLERIMKRLGYSLPAMEDGDLTDLTIILRVTPGTPFFIQNYLLGLAGVPFGRYLLVSCVVSWIYTAAFVIFGDALLHGKGKMVMIAGGLLIAAGVLTHWARKHYAKKKAAGAGAEMNADLR